ncbi:hypothetical protein [Compostimonas suwonensis]|uniref:Integral membrane protein n=1 Tax=Compostimonas suwonensis TaxID=1048394 RepID=A0A2M9BVB4_9MICO|nr:hypothetical protein [Compostimonas suwonensis]PJJ61882.1 hypothetical protein CLV54_1669 [Compostimonas suwonensis]
MARTTMSELQATIARLEAENAALRERADAAGDANPTLELPRAEAAVRKPRGRGWTVLSVFLIVIGLVLAPVAVLSTFARAQLTDTDAFVTTFAPLADDPAVQSFVADEVVTVINEQVDIPGLTKQVFEGLDSLSLPPAASSALQLLEGPAAQGLQSLVASVVENLVASEAFSDIWEQALRTTHTQLLATLQNDPSAAVGVTGRGEIELQLGPIIEEVKQRLVDNGVGFASSIPTVDRSIVIAQSDSVTSVQLGYGIAVAVGIWLPWIALVLLAAGVVVALRRTTALIWTAAGLGAVMVVLGSGIGIGRIVFVATVSPSIIPSDAATVIYETVVVSMANTTVAVAVVAFTVAIIAWFGGPYRVPRALRGLATSGADALRRLGDSRGLGTGRFGRWLYTQRTLVTVVIAVGASAIILFVRPLTVGLIVWTAVIALLLVALREILQRPVIQVPEDAQADTPVTVG